MSFWFIRASIQGVYLVVTLAYESPCRPLEELPWAAEGTNIHQYEDNGYCRVRYRAKNVPERFRGYDVDRENRQWVRYWAARYKREEISYLGLID